MQAIRVKTSRRTEFVDVTNEVQRVVTALGIRVGTCSCMYLTPPPEFSSTSMLTPMWLPTPRVLSIVWFPCPVHIVTRKGIPIRTSRPYSRVSHSLFLSRKGSWRWAVGRGFSLRNSMAHESGSSTSKCCPIASESLSAGLYRPAATQHRRCATVFLDGYFRHLRPGALLPDEVHLLQLPHRRSVVQPLRALYPGRPA